MGDAQTTDRGYFFMNVGMDHPMPKADTLRDRYLYQRHWPLCREHGYLCAGGAAVYADPFYEREVGDVIFAYQKGHGYVGVGRVTATATPAHLFETPSGQRLPDALGMPELNAPGRDSETWDHAVGIDWIRTVTLDDAPWRSDVKLFAGRRTSCRLSHPATLDFLRETFGMGVAEGRGS
jgi:hypothetical protein